ncbi:family 5 carbohydrate esterase [Melampsora larici-populina 98AG31]|uniref:Family 5 carbohydrate esterase n=1 Tax=Melampsora larici-populina (strain 98AG31 / pathotype 3-4-7) TaxID=747676 RepID=F4RZ16_MELLP|nr:family 5 carbohydrate esterase [Melampsora larici-populina 98AG31]EGG02403.1 family 5 carbohydrate esterase [Melampsora larici-populina 98AG31]
MFSIRSSSTLLFLCLSFNLSSILATTSHLSLRDLRPRMMGGGGAPGGGAGGGGGAPKKAPGGDAGGPPKKAPGGGGPPGGGAAGGAGGATGEAAGGGCGKYAIVSARGTGEKQKNPTGYAGFIKGLLKTAPGGVNYEVVYPATTDYQNGPKQGATDAMKYISKQKGKCPSQKLVLLGYSEGAMVVVQLLAKQDFPAASVSSVIMYGNPYWQAGKAWNFGTAKSGKGVAAATGIKLPPAFGPKTQDICLNGDIICTGQGGMGAHLKYPGTQYEKDAVTFSAKMLSGGSPPAGGASGGDAGGPPKKGGAGGPPGGGASGGDSGGPPKKALGGGGGPPGGGAAGGGGGGPPKPPGGGAGAGASKGAGEGKAMGGMKMGGMRRTR